MPYIVGMDKTLRKGHRVFLTFNDGRIQSAIYKGQTDDGKLEAILVSETLVLQDAIGLIIYSIS